MSRVLNPTKNSIRKTIQELQVKFRQTRTDTDNG